MSDKENNKVQKVNLFTRFIAWWKDYGKVLLSCLRGLGNDNVTILASGLVYSSLIAIIPCITFLFVFLSTFGVLQTFVQLLIEWLTELAGAEFATVIVDTINKYSSNAMSLGVFGLLSFLVTGMFLVNKIYTVINQIFKTKPISGTIKRYAIFFVFLVVFTFLIATSVALSNTINQKLAASLGFMNYETVWTKKIGSGIFAWLAFFLMLVVVPSAKIRLGSACVGATTGLVAITIASYIFNVITNTVVSYSVIYGTFAWIFMMLLYLYITWYIIIVIAELTYVHQFRPDKNTLLGRPQPPEKLLSEALNMLLIICDKYNKGRGATSIRELTKKMAVPSGRLSSYLRDLEFGGILMPTNTQASSFVPSRPMSQISVRRVMELLFGADEMNEDSVDTIGEAVTMEFYRNGKKALGDITIEELLERI